MKGQESLIKQIQTLIESNKMPHSILLVGPEGCGKKTLSRKIAEWMHLELHEIEEKISAESFEETLEKQAFMLYSINCSAQDIKAQNSLLKLLEEPRKNVFIVLRATSLLNVLSTVQNRCIKFTFSGYSKEVLREFMTSDIGAGDLILNISNTPGDIIKMQNMPLISMYEFAGKILSKMRGANYANSLSILNRIALKNEQNLFDADTFARIFGYCIRESCVCGESYSYEYLLSIFNTFIQNLLKPNVNKKYMWEDFITRLWWCLNDRES